MFMTAACAPRKEWPGDYGVKSPQIIAGVMVLACIVAGLAFLREFIRIVRRWSNHIRTVDLAS